MVGKLCFGLLLVLPTVSGHGMVTNPAAEFDPTKMPTSFVSKIQAKDYFAGKFNDNPLANANTFARAFKAQTQYKTLRAMLEPLGKLCGYSLTKVPKKPIPADGTLTWRNPESGEGFVPSHTGPCEVWLDDLRVFQDDNCAGNYTSKPEAHIPVDYSSCTDKGCMLRFYNLAVHEPEWQVYINCVPLAGEDIKYKPPSINYSAEPISIGNSYFYIDTKM